ncbi:hypothetical protein [Streptomyces roseolus]
MPDTVISQLEVFVQQRPVLTASDGLLGGHGFDLGDLRETLVESFAAEGHDWCEIGDSLHTLSDGDAEIRLSLLEDGTGWHADYFPAGWRSLQHRDVPADRRKDVVAYTDRAHALREKVLEVEDLRVAAAAGGARAVDDLVQHHLHIADRLHEAIGDLHAALLAQDGDLPPWAHAFLYQEVEELHMVREFLSSAVLAYHHGSAGHRPDTVWGGIAYRFPTGTIDLIPPTD